LTAWSCLLAAFAVGVAACGGDDDEGGGGGGGEKKAGGNLTIYSSLPNQGDNRQQTQDVQNGIKMALEQAGGKAGNFTIKYVPLDDATASAGKWDATQVSSTARKAIGDKSTIAYIGQFNSGASAVSMPLLNEAGILQVSPSNTYCGLTREGCGEKDEPVKYYPSGQRHYVRVVPQDSLQAAAQVTYQKENGCTSLYITNDKEVYGKGLADEVEKVAGQQGLDVKGNEGIDAKAANFRSLAANVQSSGANCWFHGGITQNKCVQLTKDINAAVPDAKLFVPDGCAESAYSEKLGKKVEKQVFVTVPTLDPGEYPPEGQKFFADFKAKYGNDPQPYAIYGYEAMGVALQAIKAAGDQGNDRQAVIEAAFQIKDRKSVLGTFSFDENGDTTLTDYGSSRIKSGKFVFDKVIKAQTQ
jgi:branched-chain amino acid transport system substrate-binding protein